VIDCYLTPSKQYFSYSDHTWLIDRCLTPSKQSISHIDDDCLIEFLIVAYNQVSSIPAIVKVAHTGH